ncbi:MAG TPA: hypothetical protein VM617_03415 [Thermoanaerobaculia bacterium]|nr:hypothetical protein [Thermoanaerobaculia bacterium]
MADTRKLTVSCPDCGSSLTVDAATGEVLAHRAAKRPLAGGHDFDSLLAGLDSDRERAEETFERARAAERDRDRLLEEKFREAVKRAEEDPDEGPPRRPFDLD